MIRSILFLLLFSFASLLVAVPVRVSSFKYWKSVTSLEIPESEEQVYGVIPMDEEMSIHSGYNDIRLLLGNKSIPYLRRNAQKTETDKKGFVTPKIIFEEKNEYDQVVTLEIPDAPKNTQFLSLAVASDAPYEEKITLSMGNSPEELYTTEYHDILKYKNSADKYQSILELQNPGNYKYIKINIPSVKYKFHFPAIYYNPQKTRKMRSATIDLQSVKKYNNNDLESTVYLVANHEKKPFHGIELDFQEEIFERTITVYAFLEDSKDYGVVYNSKISRAIKNKEKIYIQLNSEIKDRWKLEIQNGDSEPLRLTGLEIKSNIQELVFTLTPEIREKQNELKVYYGNPYAYYPEFDLSGLNELQINASEQQKFSLEKETENAEFAHSIMEPPISTMILRVIFIIGLGLLAWPAYKVFLLFTKEGSSQT